MNIALIAFVVLLTRLTFPDTVIPIMDAVVNFLIPSHAYTTFLVLLIGMSIHLTVRPGFTKIGTIVVASIYVSPLIITAHLLDSYPCTPYPLPIPIFGLLLLQCIICYCTIADIFDISRIIRKIKER